jgi:hypothetical protein
VREVSNGVKNRHPAVSPAGQLNPQLRNISSPSVPPQGPGWLTVGSLPAPPDRTSISAVLAPSPASDALRRCFDFATIDERVHRDGTARQGGAPILQVDGLSKAFGERCAGLVMGITNPTSRSRSRSPVSASQSLWRPSSRKSPGTATRYLSAPHLLVRLRRSAISD